MKAEEMTVCGRASAKNAPALPQTLEIDTTDSHIPSASTATIYDSEQKQNQNTGAFLSNDDNTQPSGSSFNWKRLSRLFVSRLFVARQTAK